MKKKILCLLTQEKVIEVMQFLPPLTKLIYIRLILSANCNHFLITIHEIPFNLKKIKTVAYSR